ncbi:MAG TPA: ATP-binding protein [Gaiellaceae bacterium]|nr:ATP-binding protein [Gaiellaceae bacterium]
MTAEPESQAILPASEPLPWAQKFQRLAIELVEAHNAREVLDVVVAFGVTVADARAGAIALLDPTGERLELAASQGLPDNLTREWESLRLRDDLPLTRAVRDGEPLFIGSRARHDELFPALRGSDRPAALVCLPLIVEERMLGGLALAFDNEQNFDGERRKFKLAVARQAAYSLERARLLETEQRLRERASFLASAGELLASSLDYRQTLAQTARLAVPQLADWCAVDLLSEDGTEIDRLAVAHVDPATDGWAQELGERYPPSLDAARGVANVIRTREPEYVPGVTDEPLTGAGESDPDRLEVLRRLESSSAIIVPFVSHDRPLGALSLARSSAERRYTDEDVDLAVDLSRRAAMAIEIALLFRETQRQAEAARALDHTLDAVLLLDPAGTIRYWNPAAERLFGLRAEAVLGQRAADAVPHWQDVAEHAPAGADGAAAVPTSTIPISTSRGELWCAVVAITFEDGCVYSLRDVTAERALERARSEFIATASHELRTPVAAIYGASRTLRRTDVEMPGDQRALFLEMIERESERLRTITDQLLTAGRLDAGRLELAVSPVDVARVVETAVEPARLAAPDTIDFEVTCERTPLPAHADEDMLRQVLGNLLDNAVKYSPDGGTVAVRVRRAGPFVEIAVSDEGIGIPLEAQQRVFEKFFRADPNLSRGVGGTGLGLYIAKELVDRMDGQITVDSSPACGTTFTVRLPRAG